jgi:cation transport regulator ChaC
MRDSMRLAVKRLLGSGHPQIHTPYVLRASRYTFLTIMAMYVSASVVGSALLAAGLAITHVPNWDYARAYRSAFSSTWGLADLLEDDGQPAIFYILSAVGAIAGVLLPIFILGAFVFKLLRHDPIVWRKKVSVEETSEHGTALAIRFYSGTHSPLADIRVRVFLRVQSSDTPPRSARNYPLTVIRGGVPNDDVMLPLTSRGYPILVRVPLRPDLIDSDEEGMSAHDVCYGDWIEIQGKRTKKTNCEIIVLTSGVVVFTGDSFLSARRYLASEDLSEGQPQWIDAETDPDADPYKWTGWSNFENNANIYVFVYGSLVSRASLERTLPRGLGPSSGPFLAYLKGYRRMWNVGSKASDQAERRWLDSENDEFHGVIASLGLMADEGSRCLGAVYRVPVMILGAFDARERDYDRIDVTGLVTWAGMDDAATVFTYVPKPGATSTLDEAIVHRTAVASTEYISSIEDAFRSFGAEYLDEYRNTTPAPAFRVEGLTFEPRN